MGVRERTPFESVNELQALGPTVGGASLTTVPGSSFTLTATCVPEEGTVRRSVRALLEITASQPLYHQVTGWWDHWPFPNEPPEALLRGRPGDRQ